MQIDRDRPDSADVIDYYGDRQICDRCGATVSTYGDICTAILDDPCEGFQTYDMMLSTVKQAMIAAADEVQK